MKDLSNKTISVRNSLMCSVCPAHWHKKKLDDVTTRSEEEAQLLLVVMPPGNATVSPTKQGHRLRGYAVSAFAPMVLVEIVSLHKNF